jgi:hypothetical protein
VSRTSTGLAPSRHQTQRKPLNPNGRTIIGVDAAVRAVVTILAIATAAAAIATAATIAARTADHPVDRPATPATIAANSTVHR